MMWPGYFFIDMASK